MSVSFSRLGNWARTTSARPNATMYIVPDEAQAASWPL
jgi:hypothetical protein